VTTITALTAATTALGPTWLQPDTILSKFGAWAVVAVMVIVFVECGLLLFFLPGDSLLFVMGLFIATGAIATPIWLALILVSLAAVAGNLIGYWVGAKVGQPFFERPNSKLIKPKHIQKTHDFFEKYGARAIILARFVPIVRTFITALAGIARMNYAKFARYSIIGGVAWATILTLLGYLLGKSSAGAWLQKNIEIVAILIVAISVLPIAIEVLNARRADKAAAGDSDPA
jgi:membrane-associated protein